MSPAVRRALTSRTTNELRSALAAGGNVASAVLLTLGAITLINFDYDLSAPGVLAAIGAMFAVVGAVGVVRLVLWALCRRAWRDLVE